MLCGMWRLVDNTLWLTYMCMHVFIRLGRPLETVLARQLLPLLRRADIIVAHNANFDMGVLGFELQQVPGGDGLKLLQSLPVFCTMIETTDIVQARYAYVVKKIECAYVCMYVFMYVCICLLFSHVDCKYMFMYACMHVWYMFRWYVCTYVCLCEFMYVCMYVYGNE
jgi:hypothetical protein